MYLNSQLSGFEVHDGLDGPVVESVGASITKENSIISSSSAFITRRSNLKAVFGDPLRKTIL